MRWVTITVGLLLSGCFEGVPFVGEPDAGGVGRCDPGSGRGQSGTVDIPGCFTVAESRAEVVGQVDDPYVGWLDPTDGRFQPGPPTRVDGVDIVPEPAYWIPAVPILSVVTTADRCAADCPTAVGRVAFFWSPDVVPALVDVGAYPRLGLVDPQCAILPRPICDGAAERYAADFALTMQAAHYHRRAVGRHVGYLPDMERACRTGPCLAELGVRLATLCAQANTWRWDRDGDRAGDGCDNCVAVVNADQANRDGDRLGDACDPCPESYSLRDDQDSDRDGLTHCEDICPEHADPGQENHDGDRLGDACDDDDDNDGLSDEHEREVTETDPLDRDTDDDGVGDGQDNCPNDANPLQADADEDGEGDACRLPLLPPHGIQPRGVRFDELLLTDMIPMPVADPATWTTGEFMEGVYEALAEGDELAARWLDDRDPVMAQAQEAEEPPDGAEGEGEGEGEMMELPDPPVPDRGEKKQQFLEMMDQVGEVVGAAEAAERHVLDLVRGVNYERWAMGNFCFSLPHTDAGKECTPEVRIVRWQRRPEQYPPGETFWSNPQAIIATRPEGSVYTRHRRHDCHCRAAPEIGLPPISLEAKSTSRPDHPRYSRSYERHLVEQCRDYRFALAKMYHEAFPEVGGEGGIRRAYERLMAYDGWGAPGRPPGLAGDRRPVLEYLLSDASPALRRAMELCAFDVPDDEGLQPSQGDAWASQLRPGVGILSSAERLEHQPPLPVSAMRWTAVAPGRTHLAAAVRNCEGRITYFVKRVQREVNGGYTYDTPELWTFCDGNPVPNGVDWNADNLVARRVDPTLVLADGRPQWGNVRLPIRVRPVCPPDTINDETRAIHNRVVEHDGIQRLNLAEHLRRMILDLEIPPLIRARMDLQHALSEHGHRPALVRIPQLQSVNFCYVENEWLCRGNPLCLWDGAECAPNPAAYDRLRYPRAIGTIDWVLPGYWVQIGEDAFAHAYQPHMLIPYHDPDLGRPTMVWADADERRDLCFD